MTLFPQELKRQIVLILSISKQHVEKENKTWYNFTKILGLVFVVPTLPPKTLCTLHHPIGTLNSLWWYLPSWRWLFLLLPKLTYLLHAPWHICLRWSPESPLSASPVYYTHMTVVGFPAFVFNAVCFYRPQRSWGKAQTSDTHVPSLGLDCALLIKLCDSMQAAITLTCMARNSLTL